MKIIFRNKELEDLANGIGDHKYPIGIGKKYRIVLHELSKMKSLKDARNYRGWRAEWKEGEMDDQFGIRLNQGWRVMFKAEKGAVQVLLVRDVNNHYK